MSMKSLSSEPHGLSQSWAFGRQSLRGFCVYFSEPSTQQHHVKAAKTYEMKRSRPTGPPAPEWAVLRLVHKIGKRGKFLLCHQPRWHCTQGRTKWLTSSCVRDHKVEKYNLPWTGRGMHWWLSVATGGTDNQSSLKGLGHNTAEAGSGASSGRAKHLAYHPEFS